MRDHILSLVRPAVDRLAEQLTEEIVARVTAMVEQVELAFDIAWSAFASDIQGDTNDDTRSAVEVRAKVPATRAARTPKASDKVRRTREEPTGVRAAKQSAGTDRRGDGPHPLKSGRKPNTCRKCGAVGFTSMTCGKTHNVSTSPASRDSARKTKDAVASTPATSSISRSPARASAHGAPALRIVDASATSPSSRTTVSPPPSTAAGRRAQILAAQAKRDAARLEREQRAASYVRPARLVQGGPGRHDQPRSRDSSASNEPSASDDDGPDHVGLPVPVSTFDL